MIVDEFPQWLVPINSTAFMPILFQPVYKEYFWGGERLIHEFHRRPHPGI